MFRVISILSFVMGLTACANSSTVITGKATAAIELHDIEIFYSSPPDCEFDVVAHIDIPGEYYNRAALIDAFRSRAAAIGATAVQVIDLQKEGATEYRGSARALRCKD